jgi:UDP-glucose 4-epimerase
VRIGVTGAFGYVGALLVARLLEAGHEVVAVSLDPPAPDLPERVASIPTHIADITDAAALVGAFAGCDAIVHAAALPAAACAANPALALRVNGFGTRAVLDEAKRAGVRRVVYLSTYHAYGRETGVIDESLPARPTSDYGISKAAGEGQCFRAARAGDVEVFVTRFSNGFGAPLCRSAECWTLAFPSFVRSVAETGRITLMSAGMQQRDFLPLPDMVGAVELLLEAPALAVGDTNVVYNVGGGRSMSMRDAAALVAAEYEALTGTPAPIDLPPGTQDAAAEPPVDYRFERIAALGYRSRTDLAAEIRATLELLGVGASA